MDISSSVDKLTMKNFHQNQNNPITKNLDKRKIFVSTIEGTKQIPQGAGGDKKLFPEVLLRNMHKSEK